MNGHFCTPETGLRQSVFETGADWRNWRKTACASLPDFPPKGVTGATAPVSLFAWRKRDTPGRPFSWENGQSRAAHQGASVKRIKT